jgi:hypothetical protein
MVVVMPHRTTRFLLSGALAGALALSVSAARAAEPVTAQEARAAAQTSRDRAEHYRSLGGVGYKAGLVQSAEADAARYDALAQTLSSTPTVAEEMRRINDEAKLDDHYHALGGVTYKTGMEQRGEAALRAGEPGEQVGQTPNPTCHPTKPVADFMCKVQF